MSNTNLAAARIARDDEFFTLVRDVEAEVNRYVEQNPDLFRGKALLLPCDHPDTSAFSLFFQKNFSKLGLRSLTCTSLPPNYVPPSLPEQPALQGLETRSFEPLRSNAAGQILEIKKQVGAGAERIETRRGFLEGDGDFRSGEVRRLRDQADLIMTNPPFSFMRDFIPWILETDSHFSIIGPLSAATSPTLFPFIQRLDVWLGGEFERGNAFFSRVADDSVNETDPKEGDQFVKLRNVVWFTNIDHPRRHEPLALRAPRNGNKGKHTEKAGTLGFPVFDQINAIEVSQVAEIPADYDGLMGVPISFLQSHCPDQFELIGLDRLMDMNPRPGHRFTVRGRETFARVFIKQKIQAGA